MAPRVADAVVAPLLGPEDPAPFTVHNAQAASPWLLIADHAGQRVPARLANLGLPQVELDCHIGWDIGIAQLTRLLADALDAIAIAQTYSRLVVDCNRPHDSATLMPEVSDGTAIPGNLQLSADARRQRIEAIFAPYHARIAAELDVRAQRRQPTLLVSMHSFTPTMAGHARPWHAGVLYNRDTRLAHRLLQALRSEPDLVVGDNQPYAVSDTSDYAIPVYGEGRGLLHVELEIRQDLIADAAGQHTWAARLARILPPLARALLPH
ncbi:N-formylglutamate amidohydrolase [Xanthomonas nasturtii]|uniref:N-formylglutamate amidohydrolase n=1 Tax=Xanthomonas nasturtii TaxID=1843581 RepID=A0ABT0LRV1_9XANT|nr:N-formylglutamate amidohydrolase [Xanthomonas nasturtii]MCL1551483.1 N-formylglutamate amidohydrolase [Xanthomonas nasturtii]MCL1555830.1 N-formylglutamate amidohydrolase [Xanthomonas nasturtii]